LLALAGDSNGRQLGELGPFVVASALAAVTSTYVWGRLSDRSSRKVLILAALLGALALGVAGGLGFAARAGALARGPMGSGLAFPVVLYAMMIAYQGVRLGRATHIVDMADESTRAAYTALSNTVIGVLLIGGGIFGALAAQFGEILVLLVFALMCLAAAAIATGLDEVQ
jgi:MFS family permease